MQTNDTLAVVGAFTAVALLLTKRENAGKVHTLVVLHECHKASDVVHTRLFVFHVKDIGNSSSLVTIGLRMLTHHVKSRAKTGFRTRCILEHYKSTTYYRVMG